MDDAIEIHYAKLEEWLHDRSAVIKQKHPRVHEFVSQAAPALVQQVKYDVPTARRTLNRVDAEGKEAAALVNDSLNGAQQLRVARKELLRQHRMLGGTPSLEDPGQVVNKEDAEVATVLKDLTGHLSSACANTAASLQLQFFLRAGESSDSNLSSCLQDFNSVLYHQLESQIQGETIGQGLEEVDLVSENSTRPCAARIFPWLSQIAQEAEGCRSLSLQDVHQHLAAEFGVAGTTAAWGEEEPHSCGIDWGDDDGMVEEKELPRHQPEICLDFDDLVVDSSFPKIGTHPHAAGTVGNPVVEEVNVLTASMPLPPPQSERRPWTSVYHEKHRGVILDELLALRAFFTEQIHQGEQGAPVHSGGGDALLIAKFVASIESLLDLLSNQEAVELLRIQYSHRHKEKFLRRVELLGFSAVQKESRVKELEERVSNCAAEVEKMKPSLDVMVTSVRNLKAQVEAQLTTVFIPRQVRLTGGDIGKI